jgi:hypothetical protein
MVGLGEAPGTFWVWAPGLPDTPFPLSAAAEPPLRAEEKDSWRVCDPPNLPPPRHLRELES